MFTIFSQAFILLILGGNIFHVPSLNLSVSHFFFHSVFNFYGLPFATAGYLLEKEMAKITRAVGSTFPRLFFSPNLLYLAFPTYYW